MTSQEWAGAADRGDPRTLGAALLAAVRQAHAEQVAIPDDDYRVTDIGELALTEDGSDRPDYVHKLIVRAGELLREQGWIAK